MSRVPSGVPVKCNDDDYDLVIDANVAGEDNDSHGAKASQWRKKHSKCTFPQTTATIPACFSAFVQHLSAILRGVVNKVLARSLHTCAIETMQETPTYHARTSVKTTSACYAQRLLNVARMKNYRAALT